MSIIVDDSSEAVYCWNHALERGFALHWVDDSTLWAWFDDTGLLLRRVIAGSC